jgi:hypothetical protein
MRFALSPIGGFSWSSVATIVVHHVSLRLLFESATGAAKLFGYPN